MRKMVRVGGVAGLVALIAVVLFFAWPDLSARLFPRTCIGIAAPDAPDDGSTHFEVWTGDELQVGQLGRPSLYVNVLGRVLDRDGVERFSYRLNGRDPVSVPLGRDCRRLVEPGDFNVDLAFDELVTGPNTLELMMMDGTGAASSRVVTIYNGEGDRWPLPYSIEWGSVRRLDDVAQIVDGHWILDGDGVRTAQVGYDRLINVGDLAWTNYEATMSMTLHGIDTLTGFGWPSNGPAVGFIGRWVGHFPEGDKRPAPGFTPLGSLGWYRWLGDVNGGRLVLSNTDGTVALDSSDDTFPVGSTRRIRFRVETLRDGSHRYALKMWPDEEAEPEGWDLINIQLPDGVDSGSLLLVAHHVDVTFGDLVVTPL